MNLTVKVMKCGRPCSPHFSQRLLQMGELLHAQALALLQGAQEPNLVFMGDMNWGAPEDGEPPLPPGWCAAE